MVWYNQGGGGGSSIDYTSLLNAIKDRLASIDADTDALAPLLASSEAMQSLIETGNATASSILLSVNDLLLQAQATNANTDQLESLLTSLQTTLQTESDETQAGLVDIKNAVDEIPLDAQYLQMVDYVKGGEPVGTINVGVMGQADLSQVLISGTLPPFSNEQENFGSVTWGATDSNSVWKLVGQIQTVKNQRYGLSSAISNIDLQNIRYIVGSQITPMLKDGYDALVFVGDGSLIEVGYIFYPNAIAGESYILSVSTLESNVPESCTDFLRKIVDGVASDYTFQGSSLVPYTLDGVALNSCPIVPVSPVYNAQFTNGIQTNVFKEFKGYKSLSIYVLSGRVSVADGVNIVEYPILSENGTIAGFEYTAPEGSIIANPIQVFSYGEPFSYSWVGVL